MEKIIIIIVTLLLASQSSFCCDCNSETKSVKQAVADSKEVFVGTVISSIISNITFKNGPHIVTFQEIRLKIDLPLFGDSTKEITVLTDQSDCGQMLKEGRKYLVYAFVGYRTKKLELHECHAYCPEASSKEAQNAIHVIRKMYKKKR